MTRHLSFPDLQKKKYSWEVTGSILTWTVTSKDASLHNQKELLQICGFNGCGVPFHLSRPDCCSEVREDCGTSCFYITHLQKHRLQLDFLKKGEEMFRHMHLFKTLYVPYNFMETVIVIVHASLYTNRCNWRK